MPKRPAAPAPVPVGRARAEAPAPARGRQIAGRARRGVSIEHGFLWLLAIGRRGLVLGLTLAVLIAFAAGTVEQRWKEAQLAEQVAAQEATLRAAEERNARLREQLAESDPAAYRAWVEATARRQLNLGYGGETIYLVNWAEPPAATASSPAASQAPAPAPSARPEANWRKWWNLVRGE